MKLAALVLLTIVATVQAAPVPAQTTERWQKAAVAKHPALGQAGSALNQRFLAFIAGKRRSDPSYFEAADWPLRAADATAEQLRADEVAAKAKSAAEMGRTQAERKRAEEIAQWEREWESVKARWVFERLVFGDSEEAIVRKLNLSKIVTARATVTTRVPLSSRYRWILGESKFNIDFEMKDGLAAITFECLPVSADDLDGLIREDWDKLRAAAIERFGPPTKSVDYPTGGKLRRGDWTLTDMWERPDRTVAFGVVEEGGKCQPALRISDPTRGVTTPRF